MVILLGDFREHGLPLYLSPQLYLALVKLQADRELGKSYAGLLALVEGLHALGYLSDIDYQAHVKRYSRGLTEQTEKPLTKEELERQAKIQRIEKTLTEAHQVWGTLKPEAQAYHLKTAQEYPELPIAQLIIKDKAK